MQGACRRRCAEESESTVQSGRAVGCRWGEKMPCDCACNLQVHFEQWGNFACANKTLDDREPIADDAVR